MDTPQIMFPHLGIEIESLNRVAFTVFGFEIYWYAIFILTGICLGIWSASHIVKKRGESFEIYWDFLLVAVPVCIIGARLYFVIFSGDSKYLTNPLNILAIRDGGLAIYGAVIAGAITAIIFTRHKKMDFFAFADAFVVGLLIGQACGRMGNFFNREAFGGYTDGLLAMRYLKSTVPSGYITQDILDNLVIYNGAEYIQVHPTFLYEALWNLVTYIVLMLYSPRKKFNGQIMAYYFLCYGIGRFWIEGLRTDQLIFFGTGLAVSQILSLLLATGALIFLVYNSRKLKKEAA